MSEEAATRDRKDRKERKRKEKEILENADTHTASVEKKKKSLKKRRLDNDAEEKEAKKSRRKTVSFASDTKENTTEDVLVTAEVNDVPEDVRVEDAREARKQKKKEKREQRRKEASTSDNETSETTTSTDGAPILHYLSQYSENRSEWKFQKIRESQLLKKVLSLDVIPAKYNQALFAYLRGLKSEGARQRLRKNAQEAIKADEEQAVSQDETTSITPDDNTSEALPQSWKERYNEAVYRFKGNLNAGVKDFDDGLALEGADANLQHRFESRKRAELVLWTVCGKISKSTSANDPETTSRSLAENGEQTTSTVSDETKGGKENGKAPISAARKKRKNRTVVVEISSSSESSADSDSD